MPSGAVHIATQTSHVGQLGLDAHVSQLSPGSQRPARHSGPSATAGSGSARAGAGGAGPPQADDTRARATRRR